MPSVDHDGKIFVGKSGKDEVLTLRLANRHGLVTGATGTGKTVTLQVLAELIRAGRPASEVLHQFDPVPQLLKNVRFAGGDPLGDAAVKAAIAEGEAALAGKGRLVIRASGTEPLIRVMAEGDDAGQVTEVVDMICDAVRKATM